MKKKLGKLTALWLCWELWDWLAKNPDKAKDDWPKWKRNGGHYEEIFEDCFACAYINQNGLSTYSSDFAVGCDYKENPCIIPCFVTKNGCGFGATQKTPYQIWKTSYIKATRKKYARIIANSAYKEYVKLGGKKRK